MFKFLELIICQDRPRIKEMGDLAVSEGFVHESMRQNGLGAT